MRTRIINNEILFGIIVYTKNEKPLCGTKILEVNDKINIYFIDDSKKNIKCVDNINNVKINTFYINKHKNPKIHLIKLLNRLN